MRKLTMLVALLAVGALAIATAVAFGDHGHGGGHHGNNFRAELNGYNEVVGGPGASTGSISTTGHGRLRLRIVLSRTACRDPFPDRVGDGFYLIYFEGLNDIVIRPDRGRVERPCRRTLASHKHKPPRIISLPKMLQYRIPVGITQHHVAEDQVPIRSRQKIDAFGLGMHFANCPAVRAQYFTNQTTHLRVIINHQRFELPFHGRNCNMRVRRPGVKHYAPRADHSSSQVG